MPSRSMVTVSPSRRRVAEGETPIKEYRPTWIPRSTLSRRNRARSPPGILVSFRNAETGVSRSAGTRCRNGTTRPRRAAASNSSRVGLSIAFHLSSNEPQKTKNPPSIWIAGPLEFRVYFREGLVVLARINVRPLPYGAVVPPHAVRTEDVIQRVMDHVLPVSIDPEIVRPGRGRCQGGCFAATFPLNQAG